MPLNPEFILLLLRARTPFRVRTIGVPTRAALCARDWKCPPTCPAGAAAREVAAAGWLAKAGAETPAPPRCCAAAKIGIASTIMVTMENRSVAERLHMARDLLFLYLERCGVAGLGFIEVLRVFSRQTVRRLRAMQGPKRSLLALFPYRGMCYNRPRRGTCREARGGAGSAGARGECIPAACNARGAQRSRPARRCFPILSRLLPAAGIAALQTDLRGVRLLHVLRGLLLICFAGLGRLPLGPRSTRR